MGLKWNGDAIKRRMELATRVGVNRTMALCVGGAKEDHPFTNRTGTAEQSIRIAVAAEARGNRTVGIWGSVMNSYFKFLELGTNLTRTRTSIVQRTQIMATGIFKRARNAGAPPWKGGSWAPTLVPEAKKFYKGLTYQIEAAFMRGL